MIAHLPAVPVCVHCAKKLKANYLHKYVTRTFTNAVGHEEILTERVRGELQGYGYRSNGYFCSLTCGFRYAVKVRKLYDKEKKR